MMPAAARLAALAVVWPLAFAAEVVVGISAAAHTSRGGHAYEPYCCNGSDCSEVADEAVTAGPDGWVVILRRGEHPMVRSAEVRHVIPYRSGRVSTDGKFHLCLFPNENTARCFYAPPNGS